MKSPYFSIIIPVYNVEKYLSQCLDSIITQNFNDFEIILVNDGSKDSSLQLCFSYQEKDKRIQVLDQPNSGASKARNNALNHAKGKYVMFIDSDDWIEENTLETLYNESTDNCPLIYHGFRSVFGNGDVKVEIHGYRHSCDLKTFYGILYHTMENKMKSFIYGFTCNKLFRRDIIEKHNIRFDTALKIKEDELFTTQYCSNIEEVKIIPYAFYNYRMSFGQSLSFVKRAPVEYEMMADKLYHAICHWEDENIKSYQKQEYIYNLSKGITVAIRLRNNKEAMRLSKKCATQIKELGLSYSSFTRIHFKDRIRYRFANFFWIYITSKCFNRFYSI